MLNYNLEFKDSLFIKVSEAGTSRVVYLDDLRKEELFRKFPLPPTWDSSRKIEIKFDLVPLLAKTGRLFFKGKRLEFKTGKLFWRAEKDSSLFAPFLQELGPLEQCDLITSFCFIYGSIIGSYDFPWKWVEKFQKGPICLEGMERKKFLEEEPRVFWKEGAAVSIFPILSLKEGSGSFADLWMEYRGVGEIGFADASLTIQGKSRLKEEEKHWEKDLVQAGYQKRGSEYYCPGEKVKSTLLFLLELGWEVRDFQRKKVSNQFEIDVKEENGRIAVRGLPKKEEFSFKLLDGPLEGEWEGETLYLKKHQLTLLSSYIDQGKWEEKVKLALQGLKNGAMREVSLPGPSFKGSLFPYQQKGVDWLSHLYKWGFSGLLADEMGLGKTVQVLAFFSRLRTNLPVLIVAPSSLLYNWKSEIKRFLGLDAYLHAGPERLTQKSELQNLKIVITSYAILRLDEAVLKEVEFEVVALDEAGAIKTAATQTARAAYQLKSRFRISITGTPIENRIEELQSQFRFLMPELSSDKKSVRPFLMRRRKEEVQIDLPEKIEQIVWVEMEEGQRKVLEEFRKGVNLSGRRMEILEAILRLRQICADPRLIGIDLAGAKIERLLQDLEEMAAEKRKVLIFSQFTSMLQLIALELKQKALYLDGSTPIAQREAIVRSFQEDPEQLIFLISLKAGGVGLNLTAADTVILFDPWWNQAVENQAIDRAHRIGQKKTVIAKRYLIPNSIEEKMLKIKEKKQAASDEIFQEEGGSWSEAELLQLLED